jgi:hypothetical protein
MCAFVREAAEAAWTALKAFGVYLEKAVFLKELLVAVLVALVAHRLALRSQRHLIRDQLRVGFFNQISDAANKAGYEVSQAGNLIKQLLDRRDSGKDPSPAARRPVSQQMVVANNETVRVVAEMERYQGAVPGLSGVALNLKLAVQDWKQMFSHCLDLLTREGEPDDAETRELKAYWDAYLLVHERLDDVVVQGQRLLLAGVFPERLGRGALLRARAVRLLRRWLRLDTEEKAPHRP